MCRQSSKRGGPAQRQKHLRFPVDEQLPRRESCPRRAAEWRYYSDRAAETITRRIEFTSCIGIISFLAGRTASVRRGFLWQPENRLSTVAQRTFHERTGAESDANARSASLDVALSGVMLRFSHEWRNWQTQRI